MVKVGGKQLGKRNLGLVGTHEDYFADMLDEDTGANPSIVRTCASAEDAASSYFRNVFENSNARIRTAVIAVCPATAGRDKQLVFDASAVMTPCESDDADPGEFDVSLNVRQRR